ncbi:MAG: hypothetical protein IGR92_01920 [Leptolyngbyaceae cyanobacterium T60_A2020_046]|nr:hypothetical protein [Leptolyngbyaceae cyanobacterium T60_A2020_046]
MAELRWIEGPTGSGKTAHLLAQVSQWQTAIADRSPAPGAMMVLFAANGDNRLALVDRLATTFSQPLPLTTSTPAGFIQNEVSLFWPVLVDRLGLNPQFPMKLRPENEQELATRVWRSHLTTEDFTIPGWTVNQLVRRSLDFLQLAALAGIPTEDLATLLPEGIPAGLAPPDTWRAIAAALITWRDWCLQRGLLTYGIATELYWRHLLPHPTYRDQWPQRFWGLAADDVDEYPACFEGIVELAQATDQPVALSWNPHGKVRLGVGADPDALERWRDRATAIDTLPAPLGNLATAWADPLVNGVVGETASPEPIPEMRVIQTTSRGELLRQTAEAIAQVVASGEVAPADMAVIGPGFDAIARYTLAEILTKHRIPVESLNDQRPLVSTPLVRAVLSLIPFVYPGLGRLINRDAVAEMLVVLSQSDQIPSSTDFPDPNGRSWFDRVRIDPVRAELIADHCFQPHPDHPDLLPLSEFPRWDRIGHRAADTYETLRTWITQQRQARQQRLLSSPVSLMDRAIQQFLWRGNHLPYDQLAALRELMETAQHFWLVEGRLQQQQRFSGEKLAADLPPEGRFLQLLQQGIVTANPFPVRPEAQNQGITLATVFQYRSQRLSHRWQFWLDAGSPRWLTGTDALFGYPLFLRGWSGRPWTIESVEQSHEARLERILRDLLGRARDRVILCHSDLAVNGQEQTGPLLTLVNTVEAWEPLEPEPARR